MAVAVVVVVVVMVVVIAVVVVVVVVVMVAAAAHPQCGVVTGCFLWGRGTGLSVINTRLLI